MIRSRLARLSSRILRGIEWRLVSVLTSDQEQKRAALTRDEAVESRMRQYDMVASEDEQFYARQYIHWIKEIALKDISAAIDVLDVGCGQGRLAIAIANDAPNARVVGVDSSSDAIAAAVAYASKAGAGRLAFFTADAVDYLKSSRSASVDIVVCTEVAFWLPDYPSLIAESYRVLRRDGMLVMSFWSEYYRLLGCVRDRQWQKARLILSARAGQLSGSAITFTWQTTEEIQAILHSHGFAAEKVVGIGACSGIPIAGDGLAEIAQPSTMTPADREELMAIEEIAGVKYPGNSRYILAFGRKRVE